MARYHSYEALKAKLQGLGARPVGESLEGEPLLAVDVGQGAGRAVVLGGIHAMEWIGVEVALALLQRLVEDPPKDCVVRVHPLVNPDGYRRVERGRAAGKRSFDRTNARGVDLNRNWPTHWRGAHWRAKFLPRLGHGGSRPRSEPEVDAVCRGLDAWKAQGHGLQRALSMHSFGRKVLYPYGGIWAAPEDGGSQKRIAETIASATDYGATQSARWVPGAFAYGMELDTLHAEYGADAILVECDGGFEWLTPSRWRQPFEWFNPMSPNRTVTALAPTLERFVRGTLSTTRPR